MGVSESLSESVQVNGLKSSEFYQSSIDMGQWDQIANYSYTNNIDPYYGSNYCILLNKKKQHKQIQKYQLFFNTYQQYKLYQYSYQWRKTQKYLVQPKIIKQRKNKNLCSTFHQATIFIQRIPIRACEITDIPIDQGLYLLYCSFMGFRKIYQKTGFFQITLDMICFNKQAMVKVWLNNNLSKNLPEFYLINQNYSQSDFIFRILQLCEPLIDFNNIGEKFSEFLLGLYQNHKKTKINNINSSQITDSLKPKSVGNNQNNRNQKICNYSNVGFKNTYFTKSNFDGSLNNIQIDIKNLITFDKIIDHFQQYLKKYKLIIARQMKTIKDLFKIQKKIQNQDDIKRLNNSLQNNHKQGNQIKKYLNQQKTSQIKKLIPFINLQSVQSQKSQQNNLYYQANTIKKKKKSGFDGKNTKRTNTNTDRTMTEQFDHKNIFGYKSQEYPCGIKKAVEQKKLIPQLPFAYRPITINQGQHYYLNSPQHVTLSRKGWQGPRDRIKTTMNPNVSINIESQFGNKQRNVFFNNNYHHIRQKSSSTNFSHNTRDNIQNSFHSPTNYRFVNRFPVFNPIIKTNETKLFKKKNQCDQGMILNQGRNKMDSLINANGTSNENSNLNMNNLNNNIVNSKNMNNTSLHYYATQKQYQIDDEIMRDLNKFNIINSQNIIIQ